MMKVWGMLSSEDLAAGFDVVLDEDWYVVLMDKGERIAKYDPRDFTAAELLVELEALLGDRRGDSDSGDAT